MISYKGAFYVEATSRHKKCPQGTHWNESQHKCAKVSPELAKTRKLANSASNKANHTSFMLHSDLDINHSKALKEHRDANRLHTQAASMAGKEGFPSLLKRHGDQAAHHESKADWHQSIMGTWGTRGKK